MAVISRASLKSRQQNALDAAYKSRLWEQADGDGRYFLVDSTTTRGVFYTVRVLARGYSCTCPGFRLGGACKHSAAVAYLLNGWQGIHVILREPLTSGTSRVN